MQARTKKWLGRGALTLLVLALLAPACWAVSRILFWKQFDEWNLRDSGRCPAIARALVLLKQTDPTFDGDRLSRRLPRAIAALHPTYVSVRYQGKIELGGGFHGYGYELGFGAPLPGDCARWHLGWYSEDGEPAAGDLCTVDVDRAARLTPGD